MIREIGFEPINTHEYTKDWTQMFGLGLFWDLGGWTSTMG